MKKWNKVESQQAPIPENLRKKWGGTHGHPIIDDKQRLLGWAAEYPSYEGQEIQVITMSGELKTLTI